MYSDFREVYRRDKEIIDKCFPKDVIKRLLGKKVEEDMTQGDAEVTIHSLKKEYNKLIKRYKAGGEYLDNNDIPIEEREKWIGEFRKIIDVLNGFINEFKKLGVELTDNDVMNGFELDKL